MGRLPPTATSEALTFIGVLHVLLSNWKSQNPTLTDQELAEFSKLEGSLVVTGLVPSDLSLR